METAPGANKCILGHVFGLHAISDKAIRQVVDTLMTPQKLDFERAAVNVSASFSGFLRHGNRPSLPESPPGEYGKCWGGRCRRSHRLLSTATDRRRPG